MATDEHDYLLEPEFLSTRATLIGYMADHIHTTVGGSKVCGECGEWADTVPDIPHEDGCYIGRADKQLRRLRMIPARKNLIVRLREKIYYAWLERKLAKLPPYQG